jgi:transcriptional regulator with XRE-family HTH domain
LFEAIDKEVPPESEKRIAFAHFMQLSRRKRKLTIKEFAKKLDLDTEEVDDIENNPCVAIEPRSIVQIARYFDLQPKSLMNLAGLIHDRGHPFPQDMVRAAAHSASSAGLTREESALLEELISVLSKPVE